MAGARNSDLKDLDLWTREAYMFMFDVMNDMSGGCFKKGYRDATPAERIKEWDALTPDQRAALEQKKGPEWVLEQGAEIERLRKQVMV